MGDKTPKAAHKKSVQKLNKDRAAAQKKQAAIAAKQATDSKK